MKRRTPSPVPGSADWRAAHLARRRTREGAVRAAHGESPAKVAWRAAHPDLLASYQASYRASHRESVSAANRIYYRAHREERRAYAAARREETRVYDASYHEAHREERGLRSAAWRAGHPVRALELARRAAARRRGAKVCDHASCLVVGAAQLAWQLNPHACYLCGTPVWQGVNLHMDHVVPVSRGGLHCAENMRPACRFCNLSKHNRMVA